MSCPEARVAVPSPVRSVSQSIVTVTCGRSLPVVGNFSAPRARSHSSISASAWRCGTVRVSATPVGGGGAAAGELLDQGAHLIAVLGVQPAFQARGGRRSGCAASRFDLGTSCGMSRTSLRNSQHGHKWKGITS
jgi:hypothetical protein